VGCTGALNLPRKSPNWVFRIDLQKGVANDEFVEPVSAVLSDCTSRHQYTWVDWTRKNIKLEQHMM
jgi:hypothetical protein